MEDYQLLIDLHKGANREVYQSVNFRMSNNLWGFLNNSRSPL